MRIFKLIATSHVLVIFQQFIALWFLSDFFLARDSFATSDLKRFYQSGRSPWHEQVITTINKIEAKHCRHSLIGKPTFDKLMLILIDALGAEFVPSIRNHSSQNTNMPFVESKIRHKQAMSFVAKAATPTVTMPRVKSLVSGTIPSFVDLIYNLARDVSKFDDDNIIKIAASNGKSIVFYGDDTWLSLFPRQTFLRYKETFSFFASDYTTVDTNVTVEAIPETKLNPIDWDFLILHYLGLDHIGHVYGTNKHPLFKSKLLEMDSAIQEMSQNMMEKDYKVLIVICGDHGMNRLGNHGGSSELESNTAMVFLPINRNFTQGAKFWPDHKSLKIHQVDLAITLSLLLGQPIPRMSKGILIEPLIRSLLPEDDYHTMPCAALQNVMNLFNLTNTKNFQASSVGIQLVQLLDQHLAATKPEEFDIVASSYINISKELHKTLMETMIEQSFSTIIAIILFMVILLSLYSLKTLVHRLSFNLMSKMEKSSCLVMFLVPIVMQGSTGFLEAENLFWPVFTALAIVISLCSGYRRSKVESDKLILCCSTFILSCIWSTYCDWLRSDSYLLPTLSVIILCNNIRKNSGFQNDRKFNIRVISIGLTILVSKSIEESQSFDSPSLVFYRATVQMISLAVVLMHNSSNIIHFLFISPNIRPAQSSKSQPLNYNLSTGIILIAFLLLRRQNFTFLICNVIMESSLNSISNSLKLSSISRNLIYINLAHTAFYNQGNTNIFSTIDVKPAFFGQVHYHLLLAVPLVTLATHSTQIFWLVKLFQRIREVQVSNIDESSQDHLEQSVGSLLILRDFLSLGYYMIVCMILRNHLFIWSVLSPKLVYHSVGNLVRLLSILMVCCLTNLQRFTELKQKEGISDRHDPKCLLDKTL